MKAPTPSPEQQAVLDLGLTPIRVRAGAGTGKTTTVAMVISNLIEKHGVEAEQVLGITFTNKAAAELADRVRIGLGDGLDPGRQVEVHTYHGFAAQVLSEFGALVGVDGRVRIITPTFARQLMSERFHQRRYSYLDITQTRTLDRIRRLGDRLGDHLLQPSDLIALAPSELDEIWAERLEMVSTLVDYQEDKKVLGVVDYSDLVTLAYRIVTTFPELARAIRDRYRALVLDEYQDTNPAQRKLLMAIFDGGFPVVAVGDEDQTIYEWRGASSENFEQFPTHFRTVDGFPAAARELTLNRRSTQQILDVANVIRAKANPGADQLEAAESGETGGVNTFWADTALAEADWIARTFEELHDAGVDWSDMAVLFRKNKDFPVVVDALSRHDIPVEVANVGGLFSVPEVAEVRAWLTALERPEDSGALTQLLFGSRFRLGYADLAPLTRWVTTSEVDNDAEEPTPITLMEAIEESGDMQGLRHEARVALERFHQIYRDLLTESQGQSLVEVCRTILDRTRAWQDIEAMAPNARLTARLNIYRLLDLAEDWSPLKGRPSVGAFLDYLSVMEEEPAEELDSARLSGENAVTLVTVHRAKGLEWENVAIPAVTKDNFPSRSQQYPDPARFGEHLPPELRIDGVLADFPSDDADRKRYLRSQHMTQEWRVAYVALTRAKRRLYVSGANWYGLPEPSKKARVPSELFEIVADQPGTVNAGYVEPGERPRLLRAPVEDSPPDPLFDSGWDGALREAIVDPGSISARAEDMNVADEYERRVTDQTQRLFELAEPTEESGDNGPDSISVTGLVTYAQCPKRFYWSEVDPLPRKPNPAARRGTEIHRRIELHQRGQVPFEEMSDDLYDVPESEGAGDNPYLAYETSRYAAERATLVEAPFTLELETGYRVRGRIDAVYTDESNWEVVDFKSGRRSDDPSRVVQLQAYAVAARKVDLGIPPPDQLDVSFVYLGGGLEVVSYHADDAWVEHATAQLETLTTEMADKPFEEDPGPWCATCDFLQFCGPGQEVVES